MGFRIGSTLMSSRWEAVRLGDSIGKSQAAKRLGIPDSSLWNWIKLNRAGNLKAGASRPVALDHIEGVLIAAAEPMLNKKGGSFGNARQIVSSARSPPRSYRTSDAQGALGVTQRAVIALPDPHSVHDARLMCLTVASSG